MKEEGKVLQSEGDGCWEGASVEKLANDAEDRYVEREGREWRMEWTWGTASLSSSPLLAPLMLPAEPGSSAALHMCRFWEKHFPSNCGVSLSRSHHGSGISKQRAATS